MRERIVSIVCDQSGGKQRTIGISIMQKIAVQLERLRRHYEASIRSYDHASLLDLSAILRIWTELKKPLSEIEKVVEEKPFKTSSPPKKVSRHLYDSSYVFSYMPDGVCTYANNNRMNSVPITDEVYTNVHTKQNADGSVDMDRYVAISSNVGRECAKLIGQPNVTRCNYSDWLASEVVRINYADNGSLTRKIISREILIKRVANILDGSHSSLSGFGDGDKENQFDPAINILMDYICSGLPLPYYMLLKISKDILDNIPELLRADS